jgi:hypothetical protein
MKKGVKPVAWLEVPENWRELGNPPPGELLQSIEDPRLESLQNHAVCAFDLPVHAWVHHGGLVDADVVIVAKFEKFLPCELRTVIRDDGVRDSKAVDDVEEKFHGLLGPDCHDRPSFNPLHVAPGCFLEGPD